MMWTENKSVVYTTAREDEVSAKGGTAQDRKDMWRVGRQQELNRNFRFLSVLGFTAVLMCTWEAVLFGASYGLINGGKGGMIYTYLGGLVGFSFVIFSMAEMASMAPTSGGQYHWVSEFAPPSCQRILSYITGWVCVLGWHTGIAGCCYTVANMMVGVVAINYPDTYTYEPWHVTLLVIAVARAWNPFIHGKCLPVGPTFYGLAGFTIVCDVVIIFLPIPLLLQLNVKPAQKAGVVCLFLLGLFTTICSILRLTQIHRVVSVDGDSTMLVLWGTIEFNIGNIVTSLPFLTPLLKMFIRDFRSRSGSQLRKNTGYTLQSFSKNQRSQLKSEHSKEPAPFKRTPSEELILDSADPTHQANAEIHVTVEYRVSLENK
ncbi:hypothetical protein CNMCM5793_006762 [Aspergillus hiratsukae]|uniref:Rhodopsin domain-containing protein n=1 Tax=Aspergillus hiratsukae TaxID=1194566 RepID=A0A8H6P610_9EURO|nr:hypothetical protein CNMCM5793_006762 [Aspergillus hiratsukae]